MHMIVRILANMQAKWTILIVFLGLQPAFLQVKLAAVRVYRDSLLSSGERSKETGPTGPYFLLTLRA